MSEKPPRRVLSLMDRRPDDDTAQVSAIAVLEKALERAHAGEIDGLFLVVQNADEFTVEGTFDDLADATLAGGYLDDYLDEWRKS